MKLSDVVGLYVSLRDQRGELKAAFTAEDGKLVAKMNVIEAKLLEVMNKMGVDSTKTENGTVYKVVRTSATVDDKQKFLDYLKESGEWPLADVRAAKLAIEQYRETNDALPPGVDWREERVVQIRRSA